MPRSSTDPALASLTVVRPDDWSTPIADVPRPGATEAQRVALAARGDLQAWSRLYHDHFDAAFSHVCYLTGDAIAAEDLVQDVFARAMTHIGSFDGRSTFLAWIRGIALNVVRMHWRRASTTARVHHDYEQMTAASDTATTLPDQAHAQEQRMRMLYAVLESVPDTLREAFILRELEGMPAKDAAAQLGISVGNLAVRLTRARRRIRKELGQRGWLPGGSP